MENNLDSNKLRLDLFKTPDIGSRQAFNPVCFWMLMYQGKCMLFIAEVTNTFMKGIGMKYLMVRWGFLPNNGTKLLRRCMFLLLLKRKATISSRFA